MIRTYIETMLEMPWNQRAEDCEDMEYAKEILEQEHYGLEEVKERVLEFLAVRALTHKGESPVSYTHLDVYKRQRQRRLSSRRQNRSVRWNV